jgi:hypothetical protein
MAQMDDTGNVQPIRTIDDEAALDWLRAQPGGRTKLSDAELGRRWGWKRQRVGRRVKAWAKDGRITRRGNTITYTNVHVTEGAGPGTQVELVPPLVPPQDMQFVPPPVPPLVPAPDRQGEADMQPPHVEASPHPAEHHRIDRWTFLAALALATVSDGFSIYGFTSIFVGAFWPVIGMGVALEFGKLRAVTWIGRNGSAPWQGLKGALTVLVLVLMGLNVIGAFGFLAKAHIGHQVEGDVAVAGRAADVEGRISVRADLVADLDRRIGQIDGAVEKSTAKGRTNAAMQLAADQRRNRAELAAQRDQANKVLAELKIEKAKVEGDKRVAEADLGPVRYLATLLGAGDQDVLRWFILVIAVLLDPAAVLLLLAATRR